MRQVRSFVILAAAATLVACAAQPPTVPAHPPAETTAGNVNIPAGYTRIVRADGTELFCRDDPITGTRTQRDKSCLTAAQLKASQDAGQAFLNGVQSRAAGAAGAGH
jgi:hypothetical protein